METVAGLDELLARLNRITETAEKKAVQTGARAGMTRIDRAMRSAVNAADAPDAVKREARKQIASRLAKARFGDVRGQAYAKIGYGVGKRSPKTKKARTAHARYMAGQGGGHGGGVGISSSDIHWFVLGTSERFLSTMGKWTKAVARIWSAARAVGKSGPHPTGRMQPYFKGLVQTAVAASADEAIAAAREKIDAAIAAAAR